VTASLLAGQTDTSGADACPPPQRLRDFAGFQITEDLLRRGGAKANARFMHCLPRKP